MVLTDSEDCAPCGTVQFSKDAMEGGQAKPAAEKQEFCYVTKLGSDEKKSGMSAETVSARQLFLAGLVDREQAGPGGNTFAAPLFQRRYCWEEKLWETLWTDILAAAPQEEPSLGHSLGRLLLSPDGTSSGHFLCIDGQQRITTISLVLASLLERLRTLAMGDPSECAAGSCLKEELLDLLLSSREEVRGSVDDANCRFIPTHFDRNAFVKSVYGMCLGDAAVAGLIENEHDDEGEDSPVTLCVRFFREKATTLRSVSEVSATVTKLLDGLCLVVLMSKEKEGNRRFESFWRSSLISQKFWGLEATREGQGMAVVDLIRNLVLSSVSPASVATIYKEHWLHLETAIVTGMCGSARVLSNGKAAASVLSKWFSEFAEDYPWIKEEEAKEQLTMLDTLDKDMLTFPLFAIGYQHRLTQLTEECGGDKDNAVKRCIAEMKSHAAE